MTLNFKPLQSIKNTKTNTDIITLLDDAESQWIQLGGEPGLNTFYKTKLDELKHTHSTQKPSTHNEILYDKTTPVGIFWVEKNSVHYGSVTIYCKDEKYITSIAERLVQNGLFINAQIEIVTITHKEAFKTAFIQHDLIMNQRHRMALPLDTLSPFIVPDESHSYCFMSEEYCEITGKISYDAHLISKDYPDYPDMNTLEKRIQLEKNVFNGRSGDVNQTASIMIYKDNTIIGNCLVVNVKNCWGHDIVPWIFDIAIHPTYMGQKLGKKVLQLSINALIKQNMPIMGLAVTENNFSAISLYESLGFYIVDDFYEFIKPVKL